MMKKIIMAILAISVLTACSSTKFKGSYPTEGESEVVIFDGAPMANDLGDEETSTSE